MKDAGLILTKMTGTGNDFLIANLSNEKAERELNQLFPGRSRTEIAKALCDQHEGIGADGIVFILDLNKLPEMNFRWDFYNADGSSAEMCGNAARCVALYCANKKLAPAKMNFGTLAGPIAAEVISSAEVRVQMPGIADEQLSQTDSFADVEIDFDFINSGVPHVVIEVDGDEDIKDLKALAETIRNATRFEPHGTNVTFFKKEGPARIRSFSFERGVEDFTLACGTGAVASAHIFSKRNNVQECEVLMPGGLLRVSLKQERPILVGPARFIADISLYGD